MTLWNESPDNQNYSWHWMEICLSHAHTIGLHHRQIQSCMGVRMRQLRKRMWWCIYTRDRILALGMRRPALVNDDGHNIPMLTIDDFRFTPSELLKSVGCSISAQSVAKQRFSALFFIEMVKLSLHINKILLAHYWVASNQVGGSAQSTTTLTPKSTVFESKIFDQLDKELSDWFTQLPTELLTELPPPSSTHLGLDSPPRVYGAVLRMIYLATLSVLYRPPALIFDGVNAELRLISKRRIRQIAHETTIIARDLHQNNLTRYLPTAAVTALLSAGATHFLEIRSNDRDVSLAGLWGFEHCMRTLARLQDLHPFADFAMYLLKRAAAQTGVCMTQNKGGPSSCLPSFSALVLCQTPSRAVDRKASCHDGTSVPLADHIADKSQPTPTGVALNQPKEQDPDFLNYFSLLDDDRVPWNDFDSILYLEGAES